MPRVRSKPEIAEHGGQSRHSSKNAAADVLRNRAHRRSDKPVARVHDKILDPSRKPVPDRALVAF